MGLIPPELAPGLFYSTPTGVRSIRRHLPLQTDTLVIFIAGQHEGALDAPSLVTNSCNNDAENWTLCPFVQLTMMQRTLPR